MDIQAQGKEIQKDLNRIADALYQEHPNGWEVIRQYLERLILFTELLETRQNVEEGFADKYAAWGAAMGLLMDAFEDHDRVLTADVITFEVLPQLERWIG